LWQDKKEGLELAIRRVKGSLGKTKETEHAEDPWKVPWNEEDCDYVQSGEARVRLSDGKPAASKLSKMIGRIPVHYMRKPGKGCRVHVSEYLAWAKREFPNDAERDEIATEYIADIEARKAAAKRAKQYP
jgi:hypothetical protein